MLTLYHAAPSRSSTILWLMHELGEPYEIKLIDLKKNEQKAPAYLKGSPAGKVPAISDNGVIVTESPAIAVYLCDKYPKAGLAPGISAPERGAYLKWMFFSTGCLEPAFMDAHMKRESPAMAAGWPPLPLVLELLSEALKANAYLTGAKFTAADLIIGAFLRYSILIFKAIPERPEYMAYLERLMARPAFKAAAAEDEKLAGG